MSICATDAEFHLSAPGRVRLRAAEDGAYFSNMMTSTNFGEFARGASGAIAAHGRATSGGATPGETATLAADLAADLAASAPILQRMLADVVRTGAPLDALAYPDVAAHAPERKRHRHAWATKLALWQRFYAANYADGMGLAHVDTIGGMSLAMLMYAQLARLRCSVALGEMASLRRDGPDVLRIPRPSPPPPPPSAPGDSVDGDSGSEEEDAPAASRPPWWLDPADSIVLRCAAPAAPDGEDAEGDTAGSRWRTHAVALTRQMSELRTCDLTHLPANATPYTRTPLFAFTARQLAETLVYLAQNVHLLARAETPLADVEMRALLGALTMRADLLLCGKWPADVLDVPEFRRPASSGGADDDDDDNPPRARELVGPSDAMLAFLCAMLHSLRAAHGDGDRFLLPHGPHTRCCRFAGGARWGAAACLAVRAHLRRSLADSRDAIEAFADALVADWTADALAPGLADWDSYERRRLPSNDLARYWVEQTNRRERVLRLLKRYQPQHGEFIEWYLLRLQNALASYAPGRLFATFIDRLLAGNPLDAADFERHAVRALPDAAAAAAVEAGSGASSLFPQSRAAALQMDEHRAQQGQYVDVVALLRNRVLLAGMNALVEAEGGGSRWAEVHVVAQSELCHWTPVALWEHSLTRPLILQLGPLRHDVLFRGVLCHCGHDLRTTLAAWVDAASRAKLETRLATAVERIVASMREHHGSTEAEAAASTGVRGAEAERDADWPLPPTDQPLGYRINLGGGRGGGDASDDGHRGEDVDDADLYVNFEDLLNRDRSSVAGALAKHVVSMLGGQSRYITYRDEDDDGGGGGGGGDAASGGETTAGSDAADTEPAWNGHDDNGGGGGGGGSSSSGLSEDDDDGGADTGGHPPRRHHLPSLAQRLAERVTLQTPMPAPHRTAAAPDTEMSPARRELWQQQMRRWEWRA